MITSSEIIFDRIKFDSHQISELSTVKAATEGKGDGTVGSIVPLQGGSEGRPIWPTGRMLGPAVWTGREWEKEGKGGIE